MLGHLSTTKMKIAKAPVLLKKATAMCKGKTSVIMARLLVLASLRRRVAMIGAFTHRIHTLIVAYQEKGSKVYYRKPLVCKVEKHVNLGMVDVLSRHSTLFDQVDRVVAALSGHCTPSSVTVTIVVTLMSAMTMMMMETRGAMRTKQEAEGLEFNMNEDIDQAAEMFIRRFREQMNMSFS